MLKENGLKLLNLGTLCVKLIIPFQKLMEVNGLKLHDNDGTIGWVSSNYLTIDKDDEKIYLLRN